MCRFAIIDNDTVRIHEDVHLSNTTTTRVIDISDDEVRLDERTFTFFAVNCDEKIFRFAVFINRDRGADRFDSLLSQLGLENRICANVEDVDHVMSTPINWERVDQKLSCLKEYSKEFLENSIK